MTAVLTERELSCIKSPSFRRESANICLSNQSERGKRARDCVRICECECVVHYICSVSGIAPSTVSESCFGRIREVTGSTPWRTRNHFKHCDECGRQRTVAFWSCLNNKTCCFSVPSKSLTPQSPPQLFPCYSCVCDISSPSMHDKEMQTTCRTSLLLKYSPWQIWWRTVRSPVALLWPTSMTPQNQYFVLAPSHSHVGSGAEYQTPAIIQHQIIVSLW